MNTIQNYKTHISIIGDFAHEHILSNKEAHIPYHPSYLTSEYRNVRNYIYSQILINSDLPLPLSNKITQTVIEKAINRTDKIMSALFNGVCDYLDKFEYSLYLQIPDFMKRPTSNMIFSI